VAARLLSNDSHSHTHILLGVCWCENVFDRVKKGARVYMCTQNPGISVISLSLFLGLSPALLSLRNQSYPWIDSESDVSA
jgi:hypothetical protein